MPTQDVHDAFVGFRACPILLQFEHVLTRRDRDRTGLHRAVHRTVVCFERKITAGVGWDVDF